MNRKNFFIGVGIIEILYSIYAIIFSNRVLEIQIAQLKKLVEVTKSEFLSDSLSSTINSLNTGSIIAYGIIGIIIGTILIWLASKNNFKKDKLKFIVLSIFGYLLSTNSYIELLFIITLVVSLFIKKEKVEVKKDVKEKKEVKVLKKHGTNKRDILLGIGFVLLYFSDNIWGKYIPKSFALPILLAFEFILIVLALLLYKDDLKRDFKELKNNLGMYLKYCFKTWGLMLVAMYAIGIVIILITGEVNQSANQQMLQKLPLLYLIPSALIMAPIVEETIFRFVFRKIIRDDTLFIILSGLCFGLLHVTVEANILSAFISSLSYIAMGLFLAHSYAKTNNMTTSMIIHCIQNTMACILMLFM